MAGVWPGVQHMETPPGFLSPSQSSCVKGRCPENVLESQAAATSTTLRVLSAFLSIWKGFSQGQTDLSALHWSISASFPASSMSFGIVVLCLCNICLSMTGSKHRHGRPWCLALRWSQAMHVLWCRQAPHMSLPAARMRENHSKC